MYACPLLVCLLVCCGALQWTVYVWYWVELRTAALGIQCYCYWSTLRQSSGRSRWVFHVEKIMTSLQSTPDISWTRTLSSVCPHISLALIFDYCPNCVPPYSLFISHFSPIQQYVKQTNQKKYCKYSTFSIEAHKGVRFSWCNNHLRTLHYNYNPF